MNQARSKKSDEKEASGKNILMPEVFVSNHMKQQRNFVHYKRNKNTYSLGEKAVARFGGSAYKATVNPLMQAKENSLLLVVRIKGLNMGTTPQAQKILSEIGLRSINNGVFLKANTETLKRLQIIQDYVTFGYPTKKMVNDLIRKRGNLRKDDKKLAITDNVLIEELLGCDVLGPQGCICIEDIIETIWKCSDESLFTVFEGIQKVLWPF